MTEERLALVGLNMVRGIGAVTARKLIAAFGGAANALNAQFGDLLKIEGIGATKARSFAEEFRRVNPEKEFEQAEKCDARIIVLGDADYPAQLNKIYDPPIALYVLGNLSGFSQSSVAIVGTRSPTHYGMETAFRFSYQLASAGIAVISGMARGIDTEAHRGAVEAHGRTIGVLGGALDRFYPVENTDLGRRVIDSDGILLSEYPFGRTPDRQTFPQRNRIISGLAAGVLVIESSSHSGTLITVDQALEQGRTVMAVPGRVDSPVSQGCHRLIRDGARLIGSVDDILEEISELPAPRKKTMTDSAGSSKYTLSEEEQAVLAALQNEEKSVDTLVETTGIDAGRLNGLLVAMQIKRLLKMLPGGRVSGAQSPD